MDSEYYSEKIINDFVKKDVCQNDPALLRYYKTNNVKKFRNRLKILKTDPKTIEKIIYIYITDSIRDVILNFIGNLSVFMKPMGDLIISGGEAFNTYFDNKDRIITSDIDTKFIPIMKLKNGTIIGPSYYKYFGFLQVIKLILWEYLGKHCKELEKQIRKRLKKNKLSYIFGIKLPDDNNPIVTRRYTLIRKMKQSNNNSSNVKEGDVLIDVELFALDLRLKYYSIEKNRITEQILGGILDIALMRPFEVGFEAIYSQQRGLPYKDNLTGKIIFNNDISLAGKKFLVEDLQLLKSLGLRPKKKEKDKKRMLDFSRKVLNVKNINSSTKDDVIFKKAMNEVSKLSYTYDIKDRPIFSPNKYLKLALKVNPEVNSKYTTKPERKKIISQFMFGLRGPRNINVQGFKRTSGPFRFNLNKKQWVSNKRPIYIKNENNFRLNKKFINSNQKISSFNNVILYGYSPSRDYWISQNIIKKSSIIPFIGLKN